MSRSDYRNMNRQRLYYLCFPTEFRFIDILPPKKVKQRPGPKPKGHPDYHPPVITQKMGRPRKHPPKEKRLIPYVRPEKMLSCDEADRRIREMDRVKMEGRNNA